MSAVCRRRRISPTLFYQRERQAKEGALLALRSQRRVPAPDPPQEEFQRLRVALVKFTPENLTFKGGPSA